jgi:hypothetical protein
LDPKLNVFKHNINYQLPRRGKLKFFTLA